MPPTYHPPQWLWWIVAVLLAGIPLLSVLRWLSILFIVEVVRPMQVRDELMERRGRKLETFINSHIGEKAERRMQALDAFIDDYLRKSHAIEHAEERVKEAAASATR
eukprot:CAMPEP_0180573940 /NCGR_PEP_ID=MMETSP1037_2-20121125/10045_1 /TAXON_ID=632150 /ORGANISM="Azadinium spinosum, Strain 3D9" /LENGTH=106 /DNA_ID=CAMNT_0022591407 /DNA_START=64 /DNA_END=380 /DNA_ORIENTATION=-